MDIVSSGCGARERPARGQNMTVINNDFYSLRHVLLQFLSVFAMNHCNSNGLQWGFSDGLLLPCMVELLARGVDILLGQEHEIYCVLSDFSAFDTNINL